MATINNVLKQLMSENNMDVTKLARNTGLPVTTVHRLCTSDNPNPTLSTLIPIAEFFNVSIDELSGKTPLSRDRIVGLTYQENVVHRKVPLYTWSDFLGMLHKSEIEATPVKYIAVEGDLSSELFAIIIPDKSYGILYRVGSIIIVNPCSAIEDSDYVVTGLKDFSYVGIKQVEIIEGSIYLRSITSNNNTSEPYVSDKYQILGVICETRFQKENAKELMKLSEKVTKKLPTFNIFKQLGLRKS
ncbi:helix-turn-helix domain-containing protein [Fastidiosibacter lacustris]|uniref:helix-turn-helix domain-containing protein n=1 Tax=Fastidiosibacter lacustris TaxID=2056695 RepID=UPI000E349962|nr:helix-turn-helix transcriptional regulator [Fastidiosibacter lacustris]